MIQRWDCNTFSTINKPADDGEFVLFADHKAEVKTLREALSALYSLFGDSPFIVAKMGDYGPMTNGDQDRIDEAFKQAEQALGRTSADRGER